MKRLYYDEGPLFISFGVAGQFCLGVLKEVPDDLAETLLCKGRLKEASEPKDAAKVMKGKEE